MDGARTQTIVGASILRFGALVAPPKPLFRVQFRRIVIAAALVLVVGVVVGTLWTSIGDSDISPAGWIAMGFGVVITLAVGIGLMALVFISSRLGYDELGRGSKSARQQNSDR